MVLAVVSVASKWGVVSVAAASLIGGATVVLVLLANMDRSLWLSSSVLKASEFKKINGPNPFSRRVVLAVIATSPLPIIPVVDRLIAANLLQGGDIAYLGYSWSLLLAVTSILTRGISTTTLVRFAKMSSATQWQVAQAVSKLFILLTVASLIVFLVLYFMRGPLVQWLFVHGKFSAGDATETVRLFGWHLMGIWGLAIMIITTRVLFALGRSSDIAMFGLAFSILYPVVAFLAGRGFGLDGLALAPAVCTSVLAAVMGIYLFKSGYLTKVAWR
jgi:peptidoglycan biosynthesis protein MviN/MurJ (putative lipid II flippase)